MPRSILPQGIHFVCFVVNSDCIVTAHAVLQISVGDRPLAVSPRTQQILGVQLVQRFRHEHPVLADQFSIEPNLAAAVFRSLDTHHVPMHLRFVAVTHTVVSLPRCEMK